MKTGIWTKTKGANGQALVELVLVLPGLLLLAFCVYDFSRAVQANNIISNMSREGANLASGRYIYDLQSQQSQEIMNALANTAQPLAMGANGMMYITRINGVKDKGSLKVAPKIKSQEGWLEGGTGFRSRINQANIADILSGIDINENDDITIVEIFYTYQSLFANRFLSFAPHLYSRTII